MGYAHIENLYRPEAQRILTFKWCYALEKIHGTSAHVAWKEGKLNFFAGGEKHENFIKLFDHAALEAAFNENGHDDVIVFGEAYGGKCQGMSKVYGPKLRFIAFDVLVGKTWLDVPTAHVVAQKLGFEFVHYDKVDTDVARLDELRDGHSQQSARNAVADGVPYDASKKEGIVLRPPFECRANNGERICAKHKRGEFCERKTPQKVEEKKREVLEQAEAIADEWVTPMRLTHVLDKIGNPSDLSAVPAVIAAMIEDVTREASGEITDSKEARKAISTRTVKLFKDRVMKISQ